VPLHPDAPAQPSAPTHPSDLPDLVELAGSLALWMSWLRRSTPAGGLSMTARTTIFRLCTDGPARISDLARAEGVTQPAMTSLVNRLEGQGVVRRTSDPGDARAALVEITAVGRGLVKERRAARTEVLAAQLQRLSPADRRALLAAGPALARLIQQPAVPPGTTGG